jgi:hypothetical protein
MSFLSDHIRAKEHDKFLEEGGTPYDPLEETEHAFIPYVIAPDKQDISGSPTSVDITKAAVSSRKVTYDLPTDKYLRHMAVKVTMGASTTSSYMDHLGVGLLDKVEFIVNGRVKKDIQNPRANLIWGLSKLPNHMKVDMLVNSLGSTGVTTTSTGPSLVIWVPMFFDPWVSPGVGPLNTTQLKKPQLRVTFKINTSLLKASGTGGSISSHSLLTYGAVISDEKVIKKEHKSYDIDYHIQDLAFADATQITPDIKGIQGNIKELFMFCTLATDLSAGVDFYKFKKIDYIKDKLNNKEVDVFLVKEEGSFDQLIYGGGKGAHKDYNNTDTAEKVNPVYRIPYSWYHSSMISNHLGGINSTNVQNHTLKLYQSAAGAACVLDIIGVVGAKYTYTKDKNLTKKT